ncbi:glutamine amidotransferase [Stella humosa]|uniref:Imidazole glycerol phosphate synthase subunit HisH n=1 Tax=Stella humosa TaxID=94 RepID=A0A3N1LIJ1_9PROT|nr:imidazole glycerol phosphate synthase subunit HisH [Stella humosa]ROP90984.1 glutamine amidotransferase [Stella humosa]BBK34666.1 imidazole glycerol phosphate synthase subunit HisH [Stella humosa]
MTIAVVDYGSGNLRSAAKALARAARDSGDPRPVAVTADPDIVRRADHVVLPGVGAFGDCRRGLGDVPGMIEALEEAVHRGGRPFLGICVGMQLMAERGVEHGVHPGLGWIAGEVRVIQPTDPQLKIPHMGWNELGPVPGHPVLRDLRQGDHVYFVHSYAIRPERPADLLVETDYGGPIAAVVGRDNLIGTQFHPEKSQAAGLGLLASFLAWRP